MHKKVWCGGGIQLTYIGTKNVSESKFNPRLVYDMVRLGIWQKNVQEGLWNTEESDEKYVLNDLNEFSWVFESMSLKCSYDFRMMNLSFEWLK